jgi:hypothetical protein
MIAAVVWWNVVMSFALCSGACPGSVLAPWFEHFGEVSAGGGRELLRRKTGVFEVLPSKVFSGSDLVAVWCIV